MTRGTILALLAFLLCAAALNAQTTCQVNRRTLLSLNGNYYDVTTTDTMLVDVANLIIKFSNGQEQAGVDKLQNNIGLTMKQELMYGNYHFSVPQNVNFITTVLAALNISEVSEMEFGYLVKMKQSYYIDRQPSPNPITNSSANLTSRWWPDDNQTQGYWELRKTQVCWNLTSNLDEFAWDITVGDPSVKVAVIDNGLVWSDNDFAPDNNLGRDFLENDNDVTPPVPSGYDIEMGTAKASIIGARTSNLYGLYGIAGGFYTNEYTHPASLMILRAGFDNVVMSTIAAAASVYYAVNNGARIINFGWYFGFEIPLLNRAFDYATEKGVTILAPAGDDNYYNNYALGVAWPANRNDVIAVGGTDDTDHRAHWYNGWLYGSNWGAGTEISLPAKNVEIRDIYGDPVNNIPPGGSALASTTHISCAMASGIAALMLSVDPCLSRDEIRQIMIESCEKVGGYNYVNGWCPELGYGRLNAYQAVKKVNERHQQGMVITQNTTWNTPKYINGNVIVASGATLTIKSSVKFNEENRLIVNTGAQLILDSATLTSRCKNWDGIVVFGNPAIGQSPESYQGKLVMSQSVVENAMCGVRLCIPDDSKSQFDNYGGGGILLCNNSTFRNCYRAISFAPYQFGNKSHITKTLFVTDKYYNLEVGFDGFIKLNSVNDININGCEFKTGQYLYYQGYGVKSFNSFFTVDAFCDNQSAGGISNCPPQYIIPSKFNSLRYGVYAENVATNRFVNVRNSNFSNCITGIYGSALFLPEVVSNSFIFSEMHEFNIGLYLDNCNQYHVENNSFGMLLGTYSTTHIGIYVRNSGPENNEIYRNTFTDLGFGIAADGYNRNSVAMTGLCIKCNDFSNTGYDIFIPKPNPPLINTTYHGIRPYQGNIGTSDKDAAGNTFSLYYSFCNFYNDLNPLVYVHHQNAIPYNTKIIPDPRTTSTVALQYNPNTTYQKIASCPSKLIGDSKEELRQQLVQSEAGRQAAETQLAAFTDGGNTPQLNLTVQSTQAPGAYTLYEQLLATSPYLSDTVMKSGIENTSALPDAMLRDVLVANPQSAKSGEVMKALDERVVPVPDEMKEEIKEGIHITGSYDLMLGNLALWTGRQSSAYTGLARIFASDTLTARGADSLAALYQAEATKDGCYKLALLSLATGNTQAAQAALAQIPVNFKLTADEETIHAGYLSLVNKVASLQQSTAALLAADSSALMELAALAANDNFLHGAIARNILHAAGLINYTEPVNLNVELKSSAIKHPTSGNHSALGSKLSGIEVYPNPASDYCIVRYNCASKACNLKLTNASGVIIKNLQLKDSKNSIIVPLKGIASGSYMVTVIDKSNTVRTAQLIIR